MVTRDRSTVTVNNDTFVLTESGSTFIPGGANRWLEKDGKMPLHLIMVQSGSYLGENDIMHFDDAYGRA